MMKIFYELIIVSVFVMGLMAVYSQWKHLLVTLLALEYLVLVLFFLLSWYLSSIDCEMYMLMVILTMAVCEGALALSIVISLMRTHGNDYFNSFTILQC